MRKLRILAADAWYHVSTAVNNREPLFWVALERACFEQVLNEARQIYVFEVRGLRFCRPEVSFFIRPDDGFELPEIMQWVKQTYAVRFNVLDGRTGHIWGTGTGRGFCRGTRLRMRRSMCSCRWYARRAEMRRPGAGN
jgi:REP element-mobilizing transposase RayT